MENNFEAFYKKGILSKDLFLDSEITKDFIEWLIPYIEGKEKKLSDFGYEHSSFNAAIDNYFWPPEKIDEGFSKTYSAFKKHRNSFNTSTDEELREICLKVLKWGGVLPKNKTKIEIIPDIKKFILGIFEITNQKEIIIDDLNPNYITSGLTKIYSAFNEDFIIYDGRVGSALCYLIKQFLIEKKINFIPTELLFGYGIGRGDNYDRNPNSENYKFPEINQNRTIHFISNIKANWLFNQIASNENVKILYAKDLPQKIFALQTALFEIGKCIPTRKTNEITKKFQT